MGRCKWFWAALGAEHLLSRLGQLENLNRPHAHVADYGAVARGTTSSPNCFARRRRPSTKRSR